jgi:cytoskeletal protein CcmA (bactofilin family)
VTEASGSVFRSDSGNVKISNLHLIDDDLYVFCQALDIDGEVVGDMTAFAYKPVIRGTVGSSANLFGRLIRHQGSVAGTFRAFGEEVDIDGTIDRSALVAAARVKLGQGAVIGRDLHAAGGEITVDGIIQGNAFLRAEQIYLVGQIEGDVDIEAETINVEPSAIINGNLTYTAASDEALVIAPGSDIRGEILRREITEEEEEQSSVAWLAIQISGMLAAFFFGLVVVRLFRPYAEESFTRLKGQMAASFATGILGLIGLALCAVLLVLALILLAAGWTMIYSETGVVIGLVLVVFSTLALPLTSFAGVAGWIIYYSGKIIAAFLVGSLLFNRRQQPVKQFGGLSLIVGLIILDNRIRLESTPRAAMPGIRNGRHQSGVIKKDHLHVSFGRLFLDEVTVPDQLLFAVHVKAAFFQPDVVRQPLVMHPRERQRLGRAHFKSGDIQNRLCHGRDNP